MKRLSPAPASTFKAFLTCLISFNLLIAPIAAMAATNIRSEVRRSDSKPPAGDTSQAAAKDVFVNGPRPEAAPLPPAPNIVATLSATVVDTDGDGKADPAEKITYTATITNNGTADATNVFFNDTIDTHTTMVAGSSVLAASDTYNTIGNVNINVAAPGVLGNDFALDGGTLSIVSYGASTGTEQTIVGSSTATAQGGTVTMAADGSFTFDPKVGFTGTDTFKYGTKTASSGTAIVTVTITITGRIWFINNGAAACTAISTPCGTLAHPFSNLASFNSVNDGNAGPPQHPSAGDSIFIYESASAYTGPVTLLNNQKLIGQDSTTSLITLTGLTQPSGTDPLPAMNTGAPATTITSAGTAVTLNGASGSNFLNGFTIGNSTTGLVGTSFGTLNVGDLIINTNGQAMNLTSGAVATPTHYPGFASVTSSGGTNNIALATITGTVNLGSGGLSGPSGASFSLTDGTCSVNYSGTISQSNNAATVSVAGNHTTGTVALSGNITASNGTGLTFSNADGTYNFTGGSSSLSNSAGISIINGSGGTFSFSSGMSITSTATPFNVDGTAALVGGNITYSGTINKSNTGTLFNVNKLSGSLTFNGTTLTGSDGTVAGVVATLSNVTGSVTANNLSLTSSSSAFAGTLVGISGTNTGGTLTFNHMTLSAGGASNTGKGLTMSTGGTLAITATGGNSSIDVGSSALDLNGITLNASALQTVNAAGRGTNTSGILLTSVTGGGTLTISGGTLTGQAGAATFAVSGGNPTVTDNGAITQNAANRAADIQGTSSGTISINSVTCGSAATGIHIGDTSTNNGNVSFTTLNLGTSGARMTNQAVTITNGGSSTTDSLGTVSIFTNGAKGIGVTSLDGTFNITDGTVDSTSANAININGPGGLTTLGVSLTKVNASGGTATGIMIQNTNGSFTVNGDGSNTTKGGNASGGTIATIGDGGSDNNPAVGTGISLNNVTNITLKRMQLNDFGNYAVRGINVTGFTFQYDTISGSNGSTNVGMEGDLAFGDSEPSGTNGLLGTALIDNCKISGGVENNVETYLQSGTLTSLTVSNSDIKSNSVSLGNDGILAEAQGTSNMTISVQSCAFTDNKAQAVQFNTLDTATGNITVNNSSVAKSTQGNEGFTASNAESSQLTAHFTNNTGSTLDGVYAFVGNVAANATSSSSLTGVITGNNFTGATTSQNNVIIAFLSSTVGQTATSNVTVSNNTVVQNSTAGTVGGILVDTPDNLTTPSFTATVNSNNVTIGDHVNGIQGIRVQARRGAGCFRVSGNTTSGEPAGVNGLRVRQSSPATVNLEQGGSSGTAATVVAANNPAATTEVIGTVTVVSNGTCLPAAAQLHLPGANEREYTAQNGSLQQADISSLISLLIPESQFASDFAGLNVTGDLPAATRMPSASVIAEAKVAAEANTASSSPASSLVNRAANSAAQFASAVDSLIEPTSHAETAEVRTQDSGLRKLNHARSTRPVTRNSKLGASAAAPVTPFVCGVTSTQICANIGTLKQGDTVQITFQVTLNNLPNLDATDLLGGAHVATSGAVSGSNFSTVNTNTATTSVDLFHSTTTLGSNNNPSNNGDQVTFTATVAFDTAEVSPTPNPPTTVPTGTVEFKSDGVDIAGCTAQPVNGSGVATCQTSALTPAGSPHAITANYSGDGNFNPNTSNTVSQTVIACGNSQVVTKIADTNDGTCDGDCSLREAIATACTNATITFDTAGVFSTPQTITLGGSELAITKNLTINAPAAAGNHVTVSGNNASRVFNVNSGKTVTISNMTVSSGKDSNLGGGIFNAGALTLTGITLSGSNINGGGSDLGAGLYNSGGTVTISNSTISGNQANGGGDDEGGGIYNNNTGTMAIADSTISGNQANGGGTDFGGGIANFGTLTIVNSTLSGNQALGGGTDDGGGIYNTGTLTLTNSTISGNSATGGGTANEGGGVFNSGTVNALNAIIAGNSSVTGPDVSGAFNSQGHNFIGKSDDSTGFTNGVNGDQVGSVASPMDPQLGALANNGGPTLTMKLGFGSPAIDAGTDVTTLNGAIDNVTTTVVVTEGTSIPAGVGFLIQIDDEQMSVTSKSTNTLTVVRGANSTSAAMHSNGAAVNPAFDQRGSGFPRKAGASVDIGAFEAAQADLSITKTDGVTTVAPGAPVTYTITVTNNGPSAANGATVADTFPGILTGVTFTSVASGGATGNTAAGSGNISDTVNMPSGSTITYTVNATVSSSATGSLSNTATVTAPAGLTDPTPGNNSATDTDTLTPSADLSITKTDGVATLVPGGSVTYTITVHNNGPSDANGASVTDIFPGTLIGVTYTSVAAGGATGNTAAGSGNISDTVNMPSGSSITYTVHATVSSSATGSLSNTATVTAPGGVTDPTPGNNSATDTDTLTPTADLSITKTDGVTTVAPGSPVTYTITVTNNGPSAANGASVIDPFPGTLTGVTFTSVASGGATGNTAAGSGNITDAVDLPSGSSITYTVNATVSSSATGTLSNTAIVAAPVGTTDPNPGNNSATDTDTLSPSADMSVTKGDSPDPVPAAANITYTITVTNNGPSDAQSLSLSDPVPANTTFVSVTTPAGWIRTDAVPVGGTGTITFTRTTQAASVSSIFTLVVNVNSGTPTNTTITNTASVSSTTSDPTPGNNSATATTLVNNTPNMKVQDAQLPEPSSGSANMLFTVTLSSPAPVGGTSVNFATADQAPGAGHAVGGGSCNGTTVDYVTSSGSLNFAFGEQIKTIPVPICADNNNAEPNETFVVNLSSPTNATIIGGQATGTITTTNQAGTFIISELRTSGPGGLGDDFVELYNNQDIALTITASDASGGYGLFKLGADCSATPVLIAQIPNGTVIPARGHYLLVGSQYSLSAYAAGDQTLTSDIENDRNVAVFSTSDATNLSTVTLQDAVGFGLNTNAGGGTPNGVCDLMREGNNLPPASGSTLQYSFFRNECDFNGSVCTDANGFPTDTNDNSADFLFADTQATATPMGQRLGAPGPQNKGSGIQRNSTLAIPLLDSTVAQSGVPNRVFDPTATGPNAVHGTLYIRRRVQNNTGGDVMALRFRIIEITTAPAAPSFTDLRALTSSDVSVPNIHDTVTCGGPSNCTVTVKGTTLEQPPNQTMGGGFNSSMRVDLSTLPGGKLAAGQSVELQLAFGAMQAGRFHVYVNVEDDVIIGGGKVPASLGSFVEDVTVKANQTISFNAPANVTYGDGDFSVGAAASSGLPVTFAGSGQCAVSSSGLVHLTGAGSCAVTASQAGDSQTNPASDVVETFTIGRAPTGTAISSSQNSVKLADTVTFTAKVSQAANIEIPTGTVQFKDNGLNLGAPVTLNGSAMATLTTSALTAGAHTITADYSGSTNLNASSGALAGTEVVSNRPLVNFNTANYTVKQSDGFASIVVNRTGDLSVPVTVDYATADSGGANCANLGNIASARCNFGAMYGTFRFAAGETQKILDIPITQNAYGHGPQTFTVNLSNVTGTDATLVTPSAANVMITDSSSPTPNAIDDTTIFVRQQYHDFLNREPDQSGLAFWKDNIDSCNAPGGSAGYANAPQCVEVKRVITSAAFFLSIEFRGTGGLVRDFYVAALDRPATNNMPEIVEFTRDTQAVQAGVVVNQGNWQTTLAANRAAFMSDFVMRPEFLGLYPTGDSPAQYVDKLYSHANVTPGSAQERLDAIAEFANATTANDPGARGRALLRITQNVSFQARELNRGFVQMQYFGYLRRNPTDAPDNNANGYNFWVTKLNQFNGDFLAAEMVKAFLSSQEYRQRFGTP